MRKIVINGGLPLQGEITISGAKNSVVALIPAIILADDVVTLDCVPDISDVASLVEIMELMGATVKRYDDVLEIDPRGVQNIPMPYGKINSLRASYYFYGSLLGRFGEATVGLPGGCDLGPRPIDLHLKAFEAMGATVSYEGDNMKLSAKETGLHGASIYMDTVSVGATINTMIAAVKANGRTIIENAAREPEIIDVATLLNNMGAHIRGAGTNIIIIDGVDRLHGTRHQVIPDRIEAGTYISLAAAVGKGIRINNVLYEHLEGFIAKLEEMGVRMTVSEDSIFVEEQSNLKAINIKTAPYPGFATDLQQPITPLLLTAEGRGTIIDTIYEKRVNHVFELAKMDADITTTNDHILYTGGRSLRGANVKATDLRAGAALVIAGLMAEGKTEITNIEFILRGYSDIIEKLRNLGADITLVEDSQDFHEIASNPENLQFIFPSQASLEESQYALANYFMKAPLGVWAICDKKTEKMIGSIKFEKLDEIKKEAELGYFLRKDVWCQGFMTEVVRKLCQLSFEEFGLKQLSIITHLENEASQRVALKSGFRLIRQFKGSDRYTRKMRDYLEFRYVKGEFNE